MRLASTFFLAAVALVGCQQASGSQVAFKSDKSQTSPADGTTTDGDKTCTKGVCAQGGDLSFCLTTASDGTCSKAEYTHDGETFTCDACDDCTAAAQQAMQSCGNAPSGSSSSSSGGSSSGGSSSGGSSSSSSSSSSSGGPTTNCQAINTTCSAGGQITYCVTSSSAGCTDITYKYGGQSYPCGGCASCTDAYYQAYTACQDAVGACDDLATCCSQIQSGYQSSCTSSLNSYRGTSSGDISCKSLLQSYRSSNLCP